MVTVANALKVLIFAVTIYKIRHLDIKEQPFMMMGDAIQSFLEVTDDSTKDLRSASKADILDNNMALWHTPRKLQWRPKSVRWLDTVSWPLFIVTSVM